MNAEDSLAARSLKGKVALITGSTSSLGLRIAEALAVRGARIALNGRSAEAGKNALKRMEELGAETVFERGDASNYDDIKNVVHSVEARLGPIDILVSSGGTPTGGPGPTLFCDYKPDELMKAIEGRLLPRIYPVHAVLPLMRERNSGSIVLMNTDAARYPTPGESLIGGAGAAIMLMTKTLAREIARWHIRC